MNFIEYINSVDIGTTFEYTVVVENSDGGKPCSGCKKVIELCGLLIQFYSLDHSLLFIICFECGAEYFTPKTNNYLILAKHSSGNQTKVAIKQ